MVIRSTAGAALLLTGLLVGAETAMACSCAPVDPMEKLAGSKGAVTARLLEVRRPPAGEEAVSSADPTRFIYRTGRVVKGAARGLKRGRRLVVQSPLSEASCGLAGEPGGLTGLFVDRDDGRWTSNLCSQIGRATMLRLGGPKVSNDNPGRCRNGG